MALVAGGAGAMGSAVARRFTAAGARVAVADRRLDAAETVAAELTDAGCEAQAVALDVVEPANRGRRPRSRWSAASGR